MGVDIGGLNYFLPIFSFLLVFILVYAVIKKSKILDNNAVVIFISLILASFFIVNAKLVEFVKFNAAWFAVFLVCIVFILIFLGFVGDDYLKSFTANKGIAFAVVSILVAAFILSAARIFKWVIDWTKVRSWAQTDWFGMILLFVIAGVVAAVISKSK
ncbi:MAG: hypothetical protein QW103_02910 [Candidatus Pacearchaeota archaeon]